jgi:hypothetical protein
VRFFSFFSSPITFTPNTLLHSTAAMATVHQIVATDKAPPALGPYCKLAITLSLFAHCMRCVKNKSNQTNSHAYMSRTLPVSLP